MRRSRFPSRNISSATAGPVPLARISINRLFSVRLNLWSLVLVCLLGIACLRLIYLQVIRHGYYLKQAHAYHMREWITPSERGMILDRNGKALAMNLPQKAIFVDPKLYQDAVAQFAASKIAKPSDKGAKRAKSLTDPVQDCSKVAAILGMEQAELAEKLAKQSRYVSLNEAVPEEVAKRLSALKLRWLGMRGTLVRVYPHGTLAAQTLGFIGKDGKGLAGIEASRNALLGGKPGRQALEVDGRGRAIPGLREVHTEPQPGRNISLTIDADIQEIAEVELAKGIEAAHAAGGAAVVMDPNTGEILALASQPAFDPNKFGESDPQRRTNPCVVGVYEPGSTFKIVMACATLESGIPMSQTEIYCSGALPIGRRTIHCAGHNGHSGAHGRIGLEKIIEKSCNIGSATLAMRLGREKFGRYVQAFGFGQKTGIELASETRGILAKPKSWSDIQMANIAFGQSISVTPLQLLRAYSVVANGGRLVKPHLIKSEEFDPGQRIMSEENAREMRRLFVDVVNSGTGKSAEINGYAVAGKTGTAQKPTPEAGYRSGKYIGSFIGFVPAERPRLALLVLIDEPQGSHYGGVVAAPVFREISRQALLRLKIPPSPEVLAAEKARAGKTAPSAR